MSSTPANDNALPPKVTRVLLTVREYTQGPLEKIRRFVIEVSDGEASIVRAGRPLVDRDRSVSMSVGMDPSWIDLLLEVEADPSA